MTIYIIIMSSFGFGRNIFPIIIPDMKNDLNISYTIIGLITALHQVGYLTFSYISGKFTARLGAAHLSVGAIIISGFSLLLLGIVNNVWIIGILIGILGICAATSWVPMISIVNQYISEKHLSKSVGLISSGTSYGVFISGIAVPYLLKGYGWKSVWIVSGSVVLTIGLLGYIYLYWMGAFKIKGTYKKELSKTVLATQLRHLEGDKSYPTG
ncbi:MAG: MFS transporter [Proteobacteria bacterium]|nr:MFS transporter [Pseudomonadota bacterium]